MSGYYIYIYIYIYRFFTLNEEHNLREYESKFPSITAEPKRDEVREKWRIFFTIRNLTTFTHSRTTKNKMSETWRK
jgi:hypothetical protein